MKNSFTTIALVILIITLIELQFIVTWSDATQNRKAINENRTSLTEVVQIFNGIGKLFIEEQEEGLNNN